MKYVLFGCLVLLLISGIACQAANVIDGETAAAASGHKHVAAIDPYVSFLKKQKTEPVDYILDLFKKHDIVILCERMHPEITQWDMIYQITSDKRFIDEVGVVFTELGVVNLQPDLDDYLLKTDLSSEQANQKLLHIARNLSFWPIWQYTNIYNYLEKLRKLNGTLPQDKKIRLYFSDLPWDWSKITTGEQLVQEFNRLYQRDKLMADCVIQEVNRRIAAGEKKKCLVVVNYRHAFVQPERDNAGYYIQKAFPGRVANVLINSVRPVTVRSDDDIDMDVIQDGKWDAAFEAVGNPDRGFDFKGSPFGGDSFDLFPFIPEIAAMHYEDMFTGFVFYKPLAEQHWQTGFPGLLDEAFLKEVRRRFKVPEGTTVAGNYSMMQKYFEEELVKNAKPGASLEDFSYTQDVKTIYAGSIRKISNWLVEGSDSKH